MKNIVLLSIVFIAAITPVKKLAAQEPVMEVIKAGIKKVIKAVDLKIQRLQNKTIWLQNAQKAIENEMSKLKLNEIKDWAKKQQLLFKDYYEELYKAKIVFSYYERIKAIGQKQVRLVEEYKRAWALFKQDKHFSKYELSYMQNVYQGILGESVRSLDQLFLVVNSFLTQMSDAKRLEIIKAAEAEVDENYYSLIKFNRQNKALSLQRAKDQNDIDTVRKLYGL